MKKFYLLLVLALCIGQFVSAQTVTREVINFTDLAQYEKTFGAPAPCRNCEKEKEGGKRLISDRPIPTGATVLNANNQIVSNSPNSPAAPLAASLPPTQTFLGHVDPGQTIPPDTHGAVGINHVITATNDFVKIHNKIGGAQVSQVSLSTFTGIANTCDPYIIFDEKAQRFYFSNIECTSNGNRVILQISNTSNPTGTWTRYTWVPASTDGSLLLDHPYMGFDNRWIVVSGRKFPSAFTGPILFVFDKANLLAGGTVTFGTNAQTLEKGSADGDAPLPVMNQDASATNPASTFYILQAWNGTSIRLSTVTGNIPSATWNTASAVFPANAANPWQNGSGFTNSNAAQQLGETRRLCVNDSRISCGVLKNGSIWGSQHIFLPATGTVDRAAVQWWKLTTGGAVSEVGRVGGTTAGEWRWFSSIAVDNFDNALIGYTYSSTALRVGAAYVTKRAGIGGSGNNLTDDDLIYKAGVATYWKDFSGGTGRARWGDYSHTALDPVDGSLWTIQEYAETRSGAGTADNDSKYGVYWAQVTMPNALLARDAGVAGIISPVGGGTYCSLPITPQVTVRNIGGDTLKSVRVQYRIDGGAASAPQTFTMNLPTFGTQNVTLSPDITGPLTPGLHTFQAWTSLPNGLADMRVNNDSNSVTFNIQITSNSILDFEPAAATFPPPGCSVDNPDGARTWVKRTGVTGPTGAATSCMWLDAANYGTTGERDLFVTPAIDLAGLDSIVMSFDLAKTYWPGFTTDSLQIVYSEDCGVTWKPTGYFRGGTTFITAPPQAGDFVPSSAAEWIKERVAFATCNIPVNRVRFGFRFINGFGNNIFIDNISFASPAITDPNARVTLDPTPLKLCTNGTTGAYAPSVTLFNLGSNVLTADSFRVEVDSLKSTFTNVIRWTGSIARCSSQVVTLTSIAMPIGTHRVRVTSFKPNGLPDTKPANDTTGWKTIIVSPTISTFPIVEGFEDPAYSSLNWGNINSASDSVEWKRSSLAKKSGSWSGLTNMSRSDAFNQGGTDMLISPVAANSSSIDSMFVDWDYAYKPGPTYPGATVFPLDTLEILITKDCGLTFTSVWKKWGDQLQSLEDPNYAYVPGYTPTQGAEWKHVHIYLTPFVGSSNYQVYFVAKNNKQNNLWIDNINISSRTVPTKVKNQGYGIYPSPFTSTFRIHHWVAPVDLQAAQIYNSIGELVWDKRFAGNANTEEFVDMSKLARGVYVLKMTYASKTIYERIVKQ